MRAIRRATGLSRNTLRRWLRAGEAPNWRTGQRLHMEDAHADYLRERWEEGCRNATQLWREVRGRGYAGQVNGLRAWVAEHLRGGSARPRTGSSPAKPVWQAPSPRRTARLLTMEADHIRGDDCAFV